MDGTTKKRGRSAFVVTDAARAAVADGAKAGWTVERIADAIGVSVVTLRKYFADDLKAEPDPGGLFDETLPVMPAPARLVRTKAGGRKAYKPSAEARAEVTLLVAASVPHKVIASRLGISLPTFGRAFREEITEAYAKERAALLLDMRKAARNGNVTAQHKLIEILDQRELERVQDRLSPAKQPAPAKTESLGKKAAADLAAMDIAEGSELGQLIGFPNRQTARGA
jgi:predicted transcriptional regulator